MWPGVRSWRRPAHARRFVVVAPLPTAPLPPAADAAWDLRQWLAAAETQGEVRRVAAAVAPDQEMRPITYLVGQRVGAAAPPRGEATTPAWGGRGGGPPPRLLDEAAAPPGHGALGTLPGASRERYAL